MKRLFLLMFAFGLLASCNPESLKENEVQQIDKNKVCPPGQPDC